MARRPTRPPDTGPAADPDVDAIDAPPATQEPYTPPDPSDPVHITAEEFPELEKGLAPMLGALKRLGGLSASLELDTPRRSKRLEERSSLETMLKGMPRPTVIPTRLITVARVATRYRHGDLVNLSAGEEEKGVDPNPDLRRRLTVTEGLGRKLGIQLDVLEHAPKDQPATETPQLGLVE